MTSVDITLEENIDENDDQSDLTTRIDKINEEYNLSNNI